MRRAVTRATAATNRHSRAVAQSSAFGPSSRVVAGASLRRRNIDTGRELTDLFFVRSFSSEAAMASTGDKPTAAEASAKAESKEELPPLSDRDFRAFNRMADKMDLFHNHFRQTWNLLYNACTTNKRPSGMTLRQFLTTGLSFADQLTAHHTIEERYVFPMLATRMPEFDPKKGDLVKQHEKIHEGLDEFQGYLLRCKQGEEDFEMEGLRRRMEGWGKVLWEHLDDEVKGLGAERMRRFWTKEEIQSMPM